ncbi:spermidine synthase [Psychromonas sp. PT13]|uniref:spermidine synthase n=1 Tax=Psychromonas sp. PT13 TaxID=3439547 RepID=UPI003EBB9845
MDIQGTCIASTTDEHGPIYVYQTKNSRVLSFDGKIYQSCMKLNNINGLNLGYTQAMIMGLIFTPHLKTATIMGLGAGSLAKTLLKHFTDLTLHAIEYRAAVATFAKQYFELPETHRLTIHIDDAVNYIKSTKTKSDIIFSDLYSAEGMETKQIQAAYLQHCKAALNEQGVLVLNICHTESQLKQEFDVLLARVFNNQLHRFTIEGGNTIVFAFKNTIPNITQEALLTRVTSLQEKINVPVGRYAKLLI